MIIESLREFEKPTKTKIQIPRKQCLMKPAPRYKGPRTSPKVRHERSGRKTLVSGTGNTPQLVSTFEVWFVSCEVNNMDVSRLGACAK